MKMGWRLAWTYLTGVIGAGFASGQEIACFFVRFGAWGLAGSFLAGFLFVFFGLVAIDLALRFQTKNHKELFRVILGPVGARVAALFLDLFLFCTLVIMGAASGAVFHDYFEIPRLVGVLTLALVTAFCLRAGPASLLRVNVVFGPFLLGGMLLLVFYALIHGDGGELTLPPFSLLPHWGLAAVLYVAYNLGLVFSLFASAGALLGEAGEAKKGAILGGMLLGFLLLLLSLTLMAVPEAGRAPLPLLWIAARIGPEVKHGYAFLLWLAILTTNLATTYGLVSRLRSVCSWQKGLVLCLGAALPFTQFGFVPLVNAIYPFFGYLGGLLLLGLLSREIAFRLGYFWVRGRP